MTSTTTFAISVIAAFGGGLGLAAIIICLAGRQSEETPRARRAALGRVAARARADTPAPVSAAGQVFGGRVARFPLRVDGSVMPGTAELRHGDEVVGSIVNIDHSLEGGDAA